MPRANCPITSQWRVLKNGTLVSNTPDKYRIEGSTLRQTLRFSLGSIYEWPHHMSEKGWVDLDDFWKAFVHAFDLRYPGQLDPEIVQSTKGVIFAENAIFQAITPSGSRYFRTVAEVCGVVKYQ